MPQLLSRAWRRFREFNATNVQLWERYLRVQRPWEHDQLHWVEYTDGWHLHGTHLPPIRPCKRKKD